MAKVKVNFDIKKEQIIDKATAIRLGATAVKKSNDMIAKGLSPVKDYGRFPGYAGNTDKDKYPWTVKEQYPGKKVRPVNLWLNGWYLSHLNYWFGRTRDMGARLGFIQNFVVSVGLSASRGKYSKPPQKVKDYYETHNLGSQAPRVPMRKHIPTGQGEEFAVTIMRELRSIIERRVKAIVARQNNRK